MENSHKKLLSLTRYAYDKLKYWYSSYLLYRSSQSNILNALKGYSSKILTTTESSKSEVDIFLASLPVSCLNEEDYLDIQFWYKKQFIVAKNKKKSITELQPTSKLKNAITWYVKDANGNPINSHTVDQIHANARSIWFFLDYYGDNANYSWVCWTLCNTIPSSASDMCSV